MCLPQCMLGYTPPPPGSRLQHTVNERPVRILLECILVICKSTEASFTRVQNLIPCEQQLCREETSENFNSCTIVLCMNLYENKNAFQSKTYHLRNTEIIKTFKMGWTLLPVDMTFTLNDIDLQMALTFE